MPLLVEVDGVPADVISVPLPVGGVVSLQKVATVVYPYRREGEECCKYYKMYSMLFSPFKLSKEFLVCSSIRSEQHDSNLNDRSI